MGAPEYTFTYWKTLKVQRKVLSRKKEFLDLSDASGIRNRFCSRPHDSVIVINSLLTSRSSPFYVRRKPYGTSLELNKMRPGKPSGRLLHGYRNWGRTQDVTHTPSRHSRYAYGMSLSCVWGEVLSKSSTFFGRFKNTLSSP